MRVAFLDPLEARLVDFPKTYLAGHEALLTETAGQLPAGVETAEAIVWSAYPVDAALVERLPRLRFAQRIGLTRAKGDARALLARGVLVSVLPFGVSDRVAQHTLALTLAVLRKIVAGHAAVIAGTNPDKLPEIETTAPAHAINWARLPNVDTLNDKTVGIIGFGEIGACFARLLAPYHNRILYHKRTRLSAAHERYFGIEYAGLDDLLRTSDVVVSFVPYSEESRKMLGAREFGLMQPSAIFVNTGRGNTVDEPALIAALEAGQIAGAGLDVFSVEPLPVGHPIASAPNVTLAPHSAGGTPGWVNTFERIAINLRRVEAGQPLLLPLGPDDPEPFGG